MNELELTLAFFMNEILELSSFVGAYDKNADVIDYRKLVYLFIACAMIGSLFLLVCATCITVLIHFI